MKKNSKLEHEIDEDESEDEQQNRQIILIPPQDGPQVDTRIVGLYGHIDEDVSRSVVSGLYYLKELGKQEHPPETEDGEVRVEYEPIRFLISTEGGSVSDTFAIYDVIRDIQRECEVHTFGVGKIMSAGVLLLASGTKGKRKIGKNCRLMMHQVSSGTYGHLDDHENNYKETHWMQEKYIQNLCELTKLTRKKILAMFKNKLDYYFDAEEAVKLGIADEIV